MASTVSGSEMMSKNVIQLGVSCTLLSISLLTAPLMSAGGQQAAPDNRKVNKADRSASTPTADQGKNDSSEREVARKIRRDVVKDKTLSTYGHNVKIIAAGSRVTLRGPVRSEDERKTILQYAQKYAGDGNVVDQITIAGAK